MDVSQEYDLLINEGVSLSKCDTFETAEKIREALRREAKKDRYRIRTVVTKPPYAPLAVMAARIDAQPSEKTKKLLYLFSGIHLCDETGESPFVFPDSKWNYCPFCGFDLYFFRDTDDDDDTKPQPGWWGDNQVWLLPQVVDSVRTATNPGGLRARVSRV